MSRFMTQNPTLNINIKILVQMLGPCYIFIAFISIILVMYLFPYKINLH